MKGILFKPWKIKAIAEDDREWMTRRLDGLKEINQEPDKWVFLSSNKDGEFIFGRISPFAVMVKPSEITLVKPRYQVGETVYIKEAWRFCDDRNQISDGRIDYKANYAFHNGDKYKWRSPLFMPEWAARYFIKITDIRAERLQEIKFQDIFAEGCPVKKADYDIDPAEGYYLQNDAYEWFVYIWNSINPKYPWESNPFVFVYSFKRVEK